jgi:hypothetical protein
MRSLNTGPVEGDGPAPQSEPTNVEPTNLEQWVAAQLALAPALTAGQLDLLQTLLAPVPPVAAQSA